MTRAMRWIVVMAGLLLALPLAARETVEQFDARILAELRAKSEEAAEAFQQANEARSRGEHEEASKLYGHARALVPDFDHARRRQCGEESILGHRAIAIGMCEDALALNRSALNLAALAYALMSPGLDGALLPLADLEKARNLAREATTLDPDDAFAWAVVARGALLAHDFRAAEDATTRASALDPDSSQSHVLRAVVLAAESRFDAAEKEVDLAAEHGLPATDHDSFLEDLRRARHAWRVRAGIVALVAGWPASFVLLLVAGLVLSATALRVAQAPAATGGPSRMPASLRAAYRAVLWLSSVYFYLSLPLVFLLVLALGAGVVYACLAAGYVLIKLVVIPLLIVVVTAWAMLRSLFVRGTDADPGERLDTRRHPRFQAALAEVASRVGTAPVDDVFMTPGTELAVFERGGLLRQIRGATRRCLIVGAGGLDGLRIDAFKAILAHEHGHLTNRDTVGGGFALGARRSLYHLAESLARGGAAAWYNPAWLFVNAYLRVFLRISQGASRLQEVMADRWAASCYGSAAFVDGLSHAIRQSVSFDRHATEVINHVVKAGLPLDNLYRAEPPSSLRQSDLDDDVAKAMNAPGSPYDSHPRPADRIAWVLALGAPPPAGAGDDGRDAWSLFENREDLERRMTAWVRRNVEASSGLLIRSSSPEAPPAG